VQELTKESEVVIYYPVVIIGAGPAGLTAAYELTQRGVAPLLLERSRTVGGIARTESYKGYRFDIGGHRFFTKVEAIEQFWHTLLGPDLLKVQRLSRIYYNGKFYNYPLSLPNTLANLGLVESFLILLSYLKARLLARLLPHQAAETFEQWVSERFGHRLFRTFFKTYTEKVWGIPCDQIQADWAAQRIKGLSLYKAVVNSIFGTNDTKTLIKTFYYPRLGPGMLWERCHDVVKAQGGSVYLDTSVVALKHNNSQIQSVVYEQDGERVSVSVDHVMSSMPMTTLVKQLDPPAPEPVIAAAHALKYRDFILVALIIDKAELFPDSWIYVHSPDVTVGRIQNFKNWSAEMVPDAQMTCLGMEYFCNQGDDIWSLSDAELVELATKELQHLGLCEGATVQDGTVLRQPKAYPVYDPTYRQNVRILQTYLGQFTNLQTMGRNGMHRYNNQDHSMLTGLLAVKNFFGEAHDLWQVNAEQTYHEEVTRQDQRLNSLDADIDSEPDSGIAPEIMSEVGGQRLSADVLAKLRRNSKDTRAGYSQSVNSITVKRLLILGINLSAMTAIGRYLIG
jgi:protoporphyrinogen oxidase